MKSTDIGQALRELREAGGKQAKAVARGAVMSPSKLSKIENGVLAPSVIDVERILTALEVSEEAKARLMELARQVATEATAWRIYRRSGLHKHQEEIRAIEASTRLLRLFQPSCVPGLLQTPEYVRGILKDWDLTEDALEKMVGARLKRHDVLHDEGRRFHFLVTESVLRWEVVKARSMAMQLDKLISMSRFPNITIGVIPQQGAKPGLPTSAFTLFDARLATIEVPHAEITTSEIPDIDLYLRKFQKFERVAVTGEDMRALVAGVRDDFLRQQETR
ncbi:helix-turn-helix transcriptional regulator [Streptomyces sp. 71268]|uniref:helix-turn-helix domain-containing protein n=1 Tax=Streptomyces sp. 71268 TaxID=3002640 RepID=UPI0023F8F943|nr:helix-turn-helix transcriptional regulator [Streptomyces sp. 71268]WEV27127.1 helix-turn-helix transcriptional regulator [Streptomyces sp. 71268]